MSDVNLSLSSGNVYEILELRGDVVKNYRRYDYSAHNYSSNISFIVNVFSLHKRPCLPDKNLNDPVYI